MGDGKLVVSIASSNFVSSLFVLAFFLRSIFLFPISFGDNTPRSDRRTRVRPHCRILCPYRWNDAILEEAGVLVQFKCVT